jgi:integrase
MLDVVDFAPNPAAPELGGLGVCHVRYGKAMRGSPPRRRAVATVMPWAAEALAQYLQDVRPRYGVPSHPALWLTERGERISPRSIDERFAAWRKAARLPRELPVHCLRHSYVLGVLRPFLEVMPVLADPGYEGAGHGVHVTVKKPAGVRELDIDTRARNALIRSVRCLGERGLALLTQRWKTLQHVTASPGRIGLIARAAFVLVLFEHKMIA